MSEPALLRAIGAGKVYEVRRTGLQRPVTQRAIRGIDFEVQAGETVAIVGRSAAGKSTLARCLAGLEQLSEGEIWFAGTKVRPGVRRPIFGVQLVFQDSPTALNPRWAVKDLIAEPLRLRGDRDKASCAERIRGLMDEVGIASELEERLPGQLSGGQRQRIAIARALGVPEVRILILDEPLTGLDPANQQRISTLLARLQKQHSLGLVYISHDLAAALRLAHRLVVLEDGCAVEQLPSATFHEAARHPASRALLAAMLPWQET